MKKERKLKSELKGGVEKVGVWKRIWPRSKEQKG